MGMNRDTDARQRPVCLDNNGVISRKLENSGVFCVVIGVEAYIEVDVMR